MFLELLRTAAAQLQLPAPFGVWLERVALFLDALTSSFIEVRRASSDQSVNFTNADDIVLNQVSGGGSGIGYDTATGVFTLLAAGLYELEFHGAWTNFGTPNTTAATVEWTDGAGVALVTGHESYGVAASSTMNTAPQPVAKVLYQAAAGAQVKIKATVTGGGGTADLLRGASYAIVRKVG